jgi:cell division protein FtsI/penicillin-binding protein 2
MTCSISIPIRGSERDPESTIPLLDAMGHGEVTVTLLQLSRAFAVIANGGRLLKLHVTRPGEVERAVELRPQDLALVRKALFDVVESEAGTANAAAIPGFPFAGKTGAAQVPALAGEGEDEDKWFVAYAPPDAPKIVVGARVERAAEDRGAVFVVRELLQAYRANAR